MKSKGKRLMIALLTAGCVAAAPAAHADDTIVVRDTTDIPDGIAGVQTLFSTPSNVPTDIVPGNPPNPTQWSAC